MSDLRNATLIGRNPRIWPSYYIANVLSAGVYSCGATIMVKSVEKWLDALDRAERASGMKQWDERCKRIKRKYLYEDSQKTGNRKYQLLWSNTEQLQNSIYSKTPKGVVKR